MEIYPFCFCLHQQSPCLVPIYNTPLVYCLPLPYTVYLLFQCLMTQKLCTDIFIFYPFYHVVHHIIACLWGLLLFCPAEVLNNLQALLFRTTLLYIFTLSFEDIRVHNTYVHTYNNTW
uniref:Uncharacterized protein n=1 Tax=Cacopsylla melanoneura TaxID=428564 RepID=A0A8D9BU90_9HEMI